MKISNILKLLVLLLPMQVCQAALDADNFIHAGPMPGHLSMRSAILWLQGKQTGQLIVEYWQSDQPEKRSRSQPIIMHESHDYVVKVHLNNLKPGATYQYQLFLNHHRLHFNTPLYFRTQKLWQWRQDPPNLKIAFGSCNYVNDPPYDRPGKPFGRNYEIYDRIVDQMPDVMVWLGDNLYLREADYFSKEGMALRYKASRHFKPLQTLLQSTHHYAIWDDHDYGSNNANSSFVYKQKSLDLFKRYWANPSSGLPNLPGTFTSVSLADVDLFLLDNRFYRDGDFNQMDHKTMLGQEQLRWLKNGLANSKASFKLIINGSQMLNNNQYHEGWHHFHEERQDFIDWLKQNDINGVMFISGDRHHTELLRYDDFEKYPLYELTCSPLTAKGHDMRGELNNPLLVENTMVSDNNFCVIDVDGEANKRQLKIRVFNEDGNLMWDKLIKLKK